MRPPVARGTSSPAAAGSCSPTDSARWPRAAAAAARATSASPPRPGRRPASRSAGLPGEPGWLELQLKLLADVGLVGLPNAGKSSLLSRLTRAAPKVADYPFTTLSPVLGVLDSPERQLVVADIPGLIEGASEGAGLGHDFLAHVERTRLLVHVLDIAPELTLGADADAAENHETIERELAAHDPRLAALPRMLALSKADLVGAERRREAQEHWRERLGPEMPVIVTSSATGARHRRAAPARCSRRCRRRPRSRPQRRRRAAPGPSPAAAEDELLEHMVFRPAARAASPSSGSARARSRCAAAGSSSCSPATTSRTRTRWRTSRGGCGGSA